MIVRASDEEMPLEHTQWRIWRILLIRFQLFEVTDVKAWVALISRFGARGIRSPLCIQRIPYAELIAADWELPHPDMSIWIWQASRHDSSPCRITKPHAEHTPPDGFHGMIRSLRTDNMANADIGEEYSCMGREFGLPENFELLSMSDKLVAPNARHIEPTRILRFLDLGAKRNTLRAFAGSLRPAAPGAQSYLNFCIFGIHTPDAALRAAIRLSGKSEFRINRNSGFSDPFKGPCETTLFEHEFDFLRKIGIMGHGCSLKGDVRGRFQPF